MDRSVGSRSRCARLAGIAVVIGTAWIATSPAYAILPPGSQVRSLVVPVQGGVCRVGDFATHDRAMAVRNEMLRRGHHAWIEHHGSLYSGTRTYVVFVRC